MSHRRTIGENATGGGTPVGRAWLRQAVERSGVDVSGVTGSWDKKYFVALGGDITTKPDGWSWMRAIAYQVLSEGAVGTWERKAAQGHSGGPF